MRGKRGGGRGRGRPRGPRPPSARDLAHTPAITTFYGSEQQPIAPIFQQHTGGGAAHVGNEEQEGVASVVDLTEDASSSSNVMTSPSAQTNAVTAEKTCSVLEDFLAVYDDSDGDEEKQKKQRGPHRAQQGASENVLVTPHRHPRGL